MGTLDGEWLQMLLLLARLLLSLFFFLEKGEREGIWVFFNWG